MTTELDDDWYPTEELLAHIKQCPCNEALDLVKTLWHWDAGDLHTFWASHKLRPEEELLVHANPGEKFLRLATGGWSGNESLVGALRGNYRVRWCLSAAGGLHIFRYQQ